MSKVKITINSAYKNDGERRKRLQDVCDMIADEGVDVMVQEEDYAIVDTNKKTLRIWKLGDYKREMYPTQQVVSKLLQTLQGSSLAEDTNCVDIVWDSCIEFEKIEDDALDQTDHQRRIEEFMRGGSQKIPAYPCVPSEAVCKLRARLIFEEAMEAIDGLGFMIEEDFSDDDNINGFTLIRHESPVDIEKVADGCADISVVTIGTLSSFGIKDALLLREVDRNNLDKFRNGIVRDEFGKVIKPVDHRGPKIKNILEDQKDKYK